MSPGAPPQTCPLNDTAGIRQGDSGFVQSSNLTIMPITQGSNVDKHARRIAAVNNELHAGVPRRDLHCNLTCAEEKSEEFCGEFP